jgi:hypothetical protein|eukprot:COSAG01_NODE_1019_length_12097_cov_7.650942_6_plen_164_part_00
MQHERTVLTWPGHACPTRAIMQYVLCSALHYADRSSTRASQPQASGSCRARTRGTGHWAGGAMQGADGHALRRGDQVCVNSPGLVGVLGTIDRGTTGSSGGLVYDQTCNGKDPKASGRQPLCSEERDMSSLQPRQINRPMGHRKGGAGGCRPHLCSRFCRRGA